MNKQLLTLSVVCLFFLGACKKNKPEPAPEEKCSVSKIVRVTPPGNYNYWDMTFKSDDQGRIIRIINKSGTYHEDITNFTYSNNQIIEVVNSYDGTSKTRTYDLDNQGRISRTTKFGGQIYVNYTYNSEGYLIKTDYLNKNGITSSEQLVYTNGNLTSMIDTDQNGVPFPDGGTSFEYNDINLKDNLYFTDADYLPTGDASPAVIKYMGKRSKNLISKIIGFSGDIHLFTYESDQKGNITKIYSSNLVSGPYGTDSYSYECK